MNGVPQRAAAANAHRGAMEVPASPRSRRDVPLCNHHVMASPPASPPFSPLHAMMSVDWVNVPPNTDEEATPPAPPEILAEGFA